MMNRTSDLSKHLGNVSSTHLCNNTTYNYTELYAGIFWGTVFMLAFVTTNASYYLSLYISFFLPPIPDHGGLDGNGIYKSPSECI